MIVFARSRHDSSYHFSYDSYDPVHNKSSIHPSFLFDLAELVACTPIPLPSPCLRPLYAVHLLHLDVPYEERSNLQTFGLSSTTTTSSTQGHHTTGSAVMIQYGTLLDPGPSEEVIAYPAIDIAIDPTNSYLMDSAHAHHDINQPQVPTTAWCIIQSTRSGQLLISNWSNNRVLSLHQWWNGLLHYLWNFMDNNNLSQQVVCTMVMTNARSLEMPHCIFTGRPPGVHSLVMTTAFVNDSVVLALEFQFPTLPPLRPITFPCVAPLHGESCAKHWNVSLVKSRSTSAPPQHSCLHMGSPFASMGESTTAQLPSYGESLCLYGEFL